MMLRVIFRRNQHGTTVALALLVATLSIALGGHLTGAAALPGVRYSGTIPGGGSIKFDISPDGMTVDGIEFAWPDVATSCVGDLKPAGIITSNSFPIINGAFDGEIVGTAIDVKFSGTFGDNGTATGTVTAKYSGTTSCDFGTRAWTGSAPTTDSSPAPTVDVPEGPATVTVPGLVLVAGQRTFRIWAQNLDTSPRAVTVTYYNQDGSVVAGSSQTWTAAAGGHVEFNPPAALPASFRGLAVLTSDGPLAATVRSGPSSYAVPGGLSITRGYQQNPVMGTVWALPYVANALNQTYNTIISVVNTGTATACVQVTYDFVPGNGAIGSEGKPSVIDKGSGGAGCIVGYPVPVHGQITFGPAGAVTGVVPMPEATTNALMSARVSSTGASVAATVYAYLSGGLRKAESYGGFQVTGGPTEVGTEIAIPVALKTSDGYYSQILVSNTGDETANVAIDYSDGIETYTANLVIPAKGVANHSVYADSVVPIGFVGAARVHSDQPVAAVVFRSKMSTAGSFVDEDLYTAMKGTPIALAAQEVAFPDISRRDARTAGRDGINSWFSVSLTSGDSATISLSTIATLISTCATEGQFSEMRVISAPTVFYQNLDVDNGLGSAPACLVGATRLVSSTGILAVGNLVDDNIQGDQEAGYNPLRVR